MQVKYSGWPVFAALSRLEAFFRFSMARRPNFLPWHERIFTNEERNAMPYTIGEIDISLTSALYGMITKLGGGKFLHCSFADLALKLTKICDKKQFSGSMKSSVGEFDSLYKHIRSCLRDENLLLSTMVSEFPFWGLLERSLLNTEVITDAVWHEDVRHHITREKQTAYARDFIYPSDAECIDLYGAECIHLYNAECMYYYAAV